MGKFVYFYAIFAHFCQFQTKFSQNFALRAIFVTFWLNFCGRPRGATKKAAKNRAKIRIWDFGGWGINKKIWPEYSPLLDHSQINVRFFFPIQSPLLIHSHRSNYEDYTSKFLMLVGKINFLSCCERTVFLGLLDLEIKAAEVRANLRLTFWWGLHYPHHSHSPIWAGVRVTLCWNITIVF